VLPVRRKTASPSFVRERFVVPTQKMKPFFFLFLERRSPPPLILPYVGCFFSQFPRPLFFPSLLAEVDEPNYPSKKRNDSSLPRVGHRKVMSSPCLRPIYISLCDAPGFYQFRPIDTLLLTLSFLLFPYAIRERLFSISPPQEFRDS